MKLIAIDDLSEMLCIKQCTLYAWVETGKIPYFKINGAVRFDYEKIEEWIKSCEKKPFVRYNGFEGKKPRKGGVN